MVLTRAYVDCQATRRTSTSVLLRLRLRPLRSVLRADNSRRVTPLRTLVARSIGVGDVALAPIKGRDGREVVIGECEVEDGGVLGDPMRVR